MGMLQMVDLSERENGVGGDRGEIVQTQNITSTCKSYVKIYEHARIIRKQAIPSSLANP